MLHTEKAENPPTEEQSPKKGAFTMQQPNFQNFFNNHYNIFPKITEIFIVSKNS